MRAAVGGLVDATLVVGAVDMSKRPDVDGGCILRVDHNTADMPRVFESDVEPGLTAIHRFVDSSAKRERGPNVGLSGSNIDRLGI